MKAQIDAHVRYITETEKDIAQLIKLQNGNRNQFFVVFRFFFSYLFLNNFYDCSILFIYRFLDDNNARLVVVSTGSCESYPSPSSKFNSVEFIAERPLEVDKRISSNTDVHSINKSCDSEWGSKERSSESTQFSRFILEEKSEANSVSERCRNLNSPRKARGTCYSVELSSSNTLTPSKLASLEELTGSFKVNHVEENCNTSNETPLSIDNKLVTTVPTDPAHAISYSPGNNHSGELICVETGSFKQNTSKKALLMSAVCQSDTSCFQVEKQKQPAAVTNNTMDGNDTASDRCNLPPNVNDEQFFTPLPSDIETDNEGNNDNGMEGERTISQGNFLFQY